MTPLAITGRTLAAGVNFFNKRMRHSDRATPLIRQLTTAPVVSASGADVLRETLAD